MTLASDAEREAVATRIQSAGAEGRLTLTETEQRLTAVYAARHRHELATLTEDLPAPEPPVRRAPPNRLRIHAAVVVAVSVLLIVRWVLSGVPFFWPLFPIGWLVASLVIHARLRGGAVGGWRRVVSR